MQGQYYPNCIHLDLQSKIGNYSKMSRLLFASEMALSWKEDKPAILTNKKQ